MKKEDQSIKSGEVKRTERGWGGHFILANRCLFRRNTLLEYNSQKVVVSTVGLLLNSEQSGFDTIGVGDRYFETMAFYAKKNDRWNDADTTCPIYFDSPWAISEPDADDLANNMHEKVVRELTDKLLKGLI